MLRFLNIKFRKVDLGPYRDLLIIVQLWYVKQRNPLDIEKIGLICFSLEPSHVSCTLLVVMLFEMKESLFLRDDIEKTYSILLHNTPFRKRYYL